MRDVIFIDFDSTIIDTSQSIINLHNKLNNIKIIYTANHDWNWFPMIKTKEELSELFKLFDNKDFYGETLRVFPNSVEIINELSKKYRVIIVSKHEKSRRGISREWIYNTFPNVELVFLDSFDKSCVPKNIFADRCLCFIDDKSEALGSVKGLVDYRICYGNYSWNNTNWDGLRVINWKEVDNMIKIIENTINKNKLSNKIINMKVMVGDNER